MTQACDALDSVEMFDEAPTAVPYLVASSYTGPGLENSWWLVTVVYIKMILSMIWREKDWRKCEIFGLKKRGKILKMADWWKQEIKRITITRILLGFYVACSGLVVVKQRVHSHIYMDFTKFWSGLLLTLWTAVDLDEYWTFPSSWVAWTGLRGQDSSAYTAATHTQQQSIHTHTQTSLLK